MHVWNQYVNVCVHIFVYEYYHVHVSHVPHLPDKQITNKWIVEFECIRILFIIFLIFCFIVVMMVMYGMLIMIMVVMIDRPKMVPLGP